MTPAFKKFLDQCIRRSGVANSLSELGVKHKANPAAREPDLRQIFDSVAQAVESEGLAVQAAESVLRELNTALANAQIGRQLNNLNGKTDQDKRMLLAQLLRDQLLLNSFVPFWNRYVSSSATTEEMESVLGAHSQDMMKDVKEVNSQARFDLFSLFILRLWKLYEEALDVMSVQLGGKAIYAESVVPPSEEEPTKWDPKLNRPIPIR